MSLSYYLIDVVNIKMLSLNFFSKQHSAPLMHVLLVHVCLFQTCVFEKEIATEWGKK